VSRCIYPKLACSHCTSSDGVQRFEQEDGSINASCMSCGHFYSVEDTAILEGNEIVYDNSKKSEYSKQMIEEAHQCPFSGEYRGISRAFWKYLGVRVGVSQEDGSTPVTQLYPYELDGEVLGYKVRNLEPKKFWAYGTTKDCDMFGWRQALASGSPRLYITEGEVDCASLLQVIREKEKDKVSYKPAVVSCRNGVKSMLKDIQRVLPQILQHFKEVIIVPDTDAAGQQDLAKVNQIFPEDRKPKFARLRGKDANEMLQNGQSDLLYSDVRWNCEYMLSGNINTFTDEDFEHILKPVEMGIDWPWKRLTEITRGIRRGTTIYIGAPQKMGKSTLVNEISSHLMVNLDKPVFLIKPEESEQATLRRVVGALSGQILHDPTKDFDVEKAKAVAPIVKRNLITLTRNQTPKWSEVRQLIKEAALVKGVEDVFIDPLTNFTTGMDSSKRNDFLITMTRELAEDARSYGYTAYIFCHLNKVREGLSWNEGRVATSDDFAGSSAMVQAADLAIALSGYKLKEDEEDAEFLNKCRDLNVIDEREYGSLGTVKLIWNEDKGKLYERGE